MTRFFRSLLLDNPIITKDANLTLRRPRTWIAWLLTVGACAALSAMLVAQQHPLQPAGDALLAMITALTVVVTAVVLPAFASSTIAGEREQGTLPLLVVTGLSPLRIVVGKVAAVLIVAAPFLAIPLATLGIAAVLRGVEVVDVLAAASGVVATAICAACVGVSVSATTARARVAAPTAVLAGIVPGIFCALPTTVTTFQVLENDDPVPVLAVAAFIAASILSTAAIYSAWSALAPRSTPRFARATQVFVLVALGMPAAALGLSAFVGEDDFRAAMAGPTGLLVLVALQLFVASVGKDAAAPSTWKVVPLAWLTTFAGIALLAISVLYNPSTFTADEVSQCVTASVQCLAAASLAAALARRVSAALAAVLGAVFVIAVMLVQLVAHEALGIRALDALHFAYASTSNVAGGVLMWGAVAGLALASARKRA